MRFEEKISLKLRERISDEEVCVCGWDNYIVKPIPYI